MANKEDLSISVVTQGLKVHSNAVLNAIDDAAKYAAQLTDAQNSQNDVVWGRTLYQLADTGVVTLTVDATAKTVSCLAGAGYFANFNVGRDVQLGAFTNAGNNQTTEVTDIISPDSIKIDNATGLVNETDNAARVQESPTVEQKAVIAEIVTAMGRFGELKDALDNVAVATANRRTDLTDWIW